MNDPELGIRMWIEEPQSPEHNIDPMALFNPCKSLHLSRLKKGFTIAFMNRVLKESKYHQTAQLEKRDESTLPSKIEVSQRKLKVRL